MLTLSYVIALTLIASLSVASNLTFGRVLKQHQGSAAVINISGRQGMLSQRIASLASQLALGDTAVRSDLTSSIDQLESTAHDLVYGDGKNLPALSANVKSIYFGGSHPLYDQLTDYIARARRIAALSPGDPALARELPQLLEAARKPLFTGLDVVVGLRELESEDRLSYLQWIEAATLAATLATLAVEALLIFRPMIRRISRYAYELWLMATTDVLTGLLNRRSFVSRGNSEVARSRRYGNVYSALMIDVDHFKKVNDTYGHAGGDAVLKALAAKLKPQLRDSDLFGRLGGEEFAVFTPGISIEGATELAERLRREVAAMEVVFEKLAIQFTISVGVATAERGNATLETVLRRADRALYQAKASGRNRVMIAQ